MKKEICTFSGFIVHPGHGRRYVPTNVQPTKPVFVFINKRSHNLFLKKRNPRSLAWTVLYRRLHKKSAEMKEAKKQQRTKIQRVWRAYASLDKDKFANLRTGGKAAPKKTPVTDAARTAAKKEVEARKAKQVKTKTVQQTRAPPPPKNVPKKGGR